MTVVLAAATVVTLGADAEITAPLEVAAVGGLEAADATAATAVAADAAATAAETAVVDTAVTAGETAATAAETAGATAAETAPTLGGLSFSAGRGLVGCGISLASHGVVDAGIEHHVSSMSSYAGACAGGFVAGAFALPGGTGFLARTALGVGTGVAGGLTDAFATNSLNFAWTKASGHTCSWDGGSFLSSATGYGLAGGLAGMAPNLDGVPSYGEHIFDGINSATWEPFGVMAGFGVDGHVGHPSDSCANLRSGLF